MIQCYIQLYPQKCHSDSLNSAVDPPPLVRCFNRRVTLGSGIVTSPRCADDQAIKPGDAMGKCVTFGVLAIISKDGKNHGTSGDFNSFQQHFSTIYGHLENSQTWRGNKKLFKMVSGVAKTTSGSPGRE